MHEGGLSNFGCSIGPPYLPAKSDHAQLRMHQLLKKKNYRADTIKQWLFSCQILIVR